MHGRPVAQIFVQFLCFVSIHRLLMLQMLNSQIVSLVMIWLWSTASI